jgi:hypothetical protein
MAFHPFILSKGAVTKAFGMQCNALNVSSQDLSTFLDRLVNFSTPDGCTGSDDIKHEIMFDNDVDATAADLTNPNLAAGAAGPLMTPSSVRFRRAPIASP